MPKSFGKLAVCKVNKDGHFENLTSDIQFDSLAEATKWAKEQDWPDSFEFAFIRVVNIFKIQKEMVTKTVFSKVEGD